MNTAHILVLWQEKKKKARENTSLGQEQVPQVGCRWKTEGPGACDAQAGCDKGCKNRWETNTGCEESETPGIFFSLFLSGTIRDRNYWVGHGFLRLLSLQELKLSLLKPLEIPNYIYLKNKQEQS